MGNHNETFAYDEVGNRTSDMVLGSYSHNAGNQLVENSSYTYTYDNNGNLTRKTNKATGERVNYTYNSFDQLTRVEMPGGVTVSYTYDYFGHRVEKVVSTTTVTTTRYAYSGNGDIVAILDGNDNLIARMIYGPGTDEPLMIRTGTEESYLYADGLGSIIAVADQNGNLKETVEYQAYGKAIYKDAVSGSTATVSYTGNLYGYTGREPDAETGLYYYRARYYDPEAGRFIQPDPIGFEGGDTNLYAYVRSSPAQYTDPSGEFISAPVGVVSAIIGLVTAGGSSLLMQYSSGQKIDWRDFWISAGFGAVIGYAIMDPVGYSLINVGWLGAGSSAASYLLLTDPAKYDGNSYVNTVVGGAVGGLVAGSVKNPFMFSDLNPGIYAKDVIKGVAGWKAFGQNMGGGIAQVVATKVFSKMSFGGKSNKITERGVSLCK